MNLDNYKSYETTKSVKRKLNTKFKKKHVNMQKDRKISKGQINKSIRWMPRHQEPKKDAVSCENLRVAANKR